MHQDLTALRPRFARALSTWALSGMMDGRPDGRRQDPSSFDYNVEGRARWWMALKVGVTVEGEPGCLGNLETGDAGEEDGIGAEGKLDHSQMPTDPEEAAHLRQGDAAGRPTLPSAPATAPTVQLPAHRRHPGHQPCPETFHARIPNTHLVMHGSSSVPAELLAIINPVRRQDEGKPTVRRGNPGSHHNGVRRSTSTLKYSFGQRRARWQFPFENPDKSGSPANGSSPPAKRPAGLQAALSGVRLRRARAARSIRPEPAGRGGPVRSWCAGASGKLIVGTRPSGCCPAWLRFGCQAFLPVRVETGEFSYSRQRGQRKDFLHVLGQFAQWQRRKKCPIPGAFNTFSPATPSWLLHGRSRRMTDSVP